MDVGVDNVGYFPLDIDIDLIKAKLAQLPEIVFTEELPDGKDFEAGSSPTV